MTNRPPHQPLDYASQKRSPRRRLHRGNLMVSAVCLLLAIVSYTVAARNAGVLLPSPDPPTTGTRESRELQQAQVWFLGGCCGLPTFGITGLLFLYGAVAARAPSDS